MICSYCATELPAGAIFCGECGRPVVSRPPVAPASVGAPARPVEALVPPATSAPVTVPADWMQALADEEARYGEAPVAVESGDADSRLGVPGNDATDASDDGEREERCSECGALLAASDIFCGECGVVRVLSPRPNDTVALEPVMRRAEPVASPAEPAPPTAVRSGPIAAHVADPASDLADLEDTRIVVPGARGDRFVLQFSTGESITVTGSGLLGRNPVPEPGEHFDTLVTISDPGKSVSKTHLEFGQEGGAFWVSDRFSGNGTIVREPDRPVRRCEAGKRYRVVRGTRVDIGEQFFVVS